MSTATHTYRRISVPVEGGELAVGLWEPFINDDDAAAPVASVLAVHGVTASHIAWKRVAERLPNVRVIAPDLRGRGASNQLPGPYGMPRHAADLAAVAKHLELSGIPVIGHSMGAFASLVFAHQYPELVGELLLVDGGFPLDGPVKENVTDEELVKSVLGPAAERLTMEFESVEVYKGFWKKHPAFAENWNDVAEDYVTYDLQHHGGVLQPATTVEALMQDTVDLHRGQSIRDALANLRVKTTFLRSPLGLFAEPPGLYSPERAAQWAAQYPGVTLEDVPNTNHYTIVMDDPGASNVATHITRMLDRL